MDSTNYECFPIGVVSRKKNGIGKLPGPILVNRKVCCYLKIMLV